MPWWRFWKEETEDEKLAAERAAARVEQQKLDVIALSRGDIPAIAKERISRHNSRSDDFFSSDLSVNEFMLMKESGVQAISQVMGTCYYNVGLIGGVTTSNYTGEMMQLTEAQSQSRLLAIQRMQTEAKMLGADGVVGVRLQINRPDARSRHSEFTAFGTAVKIAGYPKRSEPFVSNLSGQEFWKLHNARYMPAGLVMGCCSYYIRQSYQAANTGFFGLGLSSNQEVDSYTRNCYEARERALLRMQQELHGHTADGAVGVEIDFDIEPIEYEQNNQTYIDLLVNYTVMGTAIHQREGVAVRTPLMYIDLTKGKNLGARVALDENDTTDREDI